MPLFFPKRVIRIQVQFRDIEDVSPFLRWLKQVIAREWTGVHLDIKEREA